MDDLKQLTTKRRFELLLEAASDYAIFFTDQAGLIVEWSTGAEKIIGYSQHEALGKDARMIFVTEDRVANAPEREMEKATRDGQAGDERWHVRKDGTRFFAVGRLVALKAETGDLFGFAKILRDATPYKTLEEALRLSEKQYHLVFSQAPLGMLVIDLDGRILQANAALCRLTGYRLEELQGREAITLTSEPDQQKMADALTHLFTSEKSSFSIEKRLRRSDGTLVWVQNNGAVLRDGEGRPVSIIDLCEDISALKLTRDQLEQMVEKRTFALLEKTKQMESFCYTVAHDLRAPLRAMAGYAEFLAIDYEAALDEQARDYLDKIKVAAGRLDRLIHDLLGYTRVQQMPVVQEPVDTTAVVDRVLVQLQQDITETGATINVRRPLAAVRGDASTLEHVFLNLVSNALKFHRENTAPILNIVAEEFNNHVRLWVEDNGIGIDPKFSGRIFRLFERVHDQNQFPGTGVGLAIVATAMERLGGKCGVEPNTNGGSRFWLEFPK